MAFKSAHQYIHEPHYLGKYQRLFSIIFLILTFQGPFFFVIGLTLYALLTLNYTILGIQAVIFVLSYPLQRSQIYIRLVRKYVVPTSYFKKFQRIFDQKIPDHEKTLFCFHPHSALAYGITANMNCGNDPMTKMRGLASRFVFNIPYIGAILRLFGVRPVDANNLKALMKKNQPIGLLPGGYQQATLTSPQQIRVYIKHRFGFIKYALQYNYTIYPTLIFNQHKSFWTFDHFTWLRLQINKVKLPSVIFFSKWLLFLNPNTQMITVVGKGLKSEKKFGNQEEPTKEQINKIHEQYIKEIERLYKKYGDLNYNTPLRFY